MVNGFQVELFGSKILEASVSMAFLLGSFFLEFVVIILEMLVRAFRVTLSNLAL